jgi:serine/threonine-protein kinase
MLAGAPAFTGQTIPEVVFKVVYEQPMKLAERVPGLDPHIIAAVESALAKPQAERFPSVTAFIEALTGTPVSIIRNPISIPSPDGTYPSSGSRTPNTGREAFDKTMGSGDHNAPALTATVAPTPLVSPDAATVASQDGRVLAPDFGTAGTIASSERPSIAPPTPPATSRTAGSKKTLALVGGVLAAAVAAAGIMYVVMRRDPPAPPTTAANDPPAIDKPIQAPVEQPPAPPPPPPIEKELLGSAAGSAETPKPPKQPKQPKQPIGDEPTNTSTNAGSKLVQAMALLDQKKWDEAGQAATDAKTDEHATLHDRAKATMIIGIVGCWKNNQESGQAAFRSLSSFPKLRKRLATACKAAGYDLE